MIKSDNEIKFSERLSIIIINYKSAQLICDCLQSIYAQKSAFSFEIIVVDNNSEDDSKQIILSRFPKIIWIAMDYNSGFARANNEGIRKSKGNVVLLLNGDTIIENNAIEKCFNQFQSAEYIACGVQLLNPDRTPQISGNYAMKGGLNYLLPLPYVGAFIKGLGNVAKIKKPNVPDATGIVEVDWINGAFLMVKKNAINKAGMLDEDFFLYAEEAEWCSRLKKTGKLCIYGACKVIHLQGETANNTFNSTGKGYYNLYDRKGLQIMLSNFVRIRKEFGVFWFLFDLFIYTFTIPIFFVAGFLHNLFFLRPPLRHFKKAINFSKNVFYLWQHATVIIKNKPYFYKAL